MYIEVNATKLELGTILKLSRMIHLRREGFALNCLCFINKEAEENVFPQ
jgi:hypothetical protein